MENGRGKMVNGIKINFGFWILDFKRTPKEIFNGNPVDISVKIKPKKEF
ncbi:MAG TPA: hypothetical protein VMT35_01160 [Ignavibacteriaceae bacterium]|nr:hypothetical protein [Ignavibacteriaceae bacterium]